MKHMILKPALISKAEYGSFTPFSLKSYKPTMVLSLHGGFILKLRKSIPSPYNVLFSVTSIILFLQPILSLIHMLNEHTEPMLKKFTEKEPLLR